MSDHGNCLENVATESFFGTWKPEFFYLNKFANLGELRIGQRHYIRC